MTLTLLYFAAIQDLVGKTEETVSLPDEVKTVQRLRLWLEAHHATLEGRLSSVRFACNEVFVTDDHALSENDVVALIPPVSGG